MIMGFFFEFVYVVVKMDGFPYIELSLHPWDEAYLTLEDDRFDVFLDSVGKNFIEYFASIFIREIGLKFSFLVGSLCGFGISVIVASKKDLGSVPSVSFWWKSLKSIGVKSSL